MELYRIFCMEDIDIYCIKYVWETNPIKAQLKVYKLYPNIKITECEHISKKVNIKCKLINKEDYDVREDNNSI